MTSDSSKRSPTQSTKVDANPPSPVDSRVASPASGETTPAVSFPTRFGLGVSIHQAGGPTAESLVSKLSEEHLSQVISQADAEDLRKHHERILLIWTRTTLLSVALVAVFFLCWLFLSYGKSELIVPIITAILGAAGGYGIGRSTAPEPRKDKD